MLKLNICVLFFCLSIVVSTNVFAQYSNLYHHMKQSQGRKLKLAEMSELIRRHNGVLDNKLSSEETDIYLLDNGSLIYKSRFISTGVLYKDKEDYFVLLKRLNLTPVQPLLSSYQTEILDISKKVPEYLKLLSIKLDVAIGPVNTGQYNLKNVSEAVNKYIKVSNFDSIYFPLIVFIGEVIKTRTTGEWAVFNNEIFPNVKEIFILTPQGNKYNPWLKLHKDYDEAKKINIELIIADILEPKVLPVTSSE